MSVRLGFMMALCLTTAMAFARAATAGQINPGDLIVVSSGEKLAVGILERAGILGAHIRHVDRHRGTRRVSGGKESGAQIDVGVRRRDELRIPWKGRKHIDPLTTLVVPRAFALAIPFVRLGSRHLRGA